MALAACATDRIACTPSCRQASRSVPLWRAVSVKMHFDVMDTGRSRNAADVLHIHGFPSQNALAAAARGLMFIERYGRVFPSQRDSHLYVTPVTTLQYVKDHPEIIDGVRLGDRIYHSGIQGGIGLWSIITTLFLRLDPDQAEQFAEHLTTGAGLHRGHPVLMLRNRLVGSQRDQ